MGRVRSDGASSTRQACTPTMTWRGLAETTAIWSVLTVFGFCCIGFRTGTPYLHFRISPRYQTWAFLPQSVRNKGMVQSLKCAGWRTVGFNNTASIVGIFSLRAWSSRQCQMWKGAAWRQSSQCALPARTACVHYSVITHRGCFPQYQVVTQDTRMWARPHWRDLDNLELDRTILPR